MAGPVLGAAAMTLGGASGLFLFTATCAGGTLAFGLWRQASTPPVPADQQQNYQALPRTTPMSAALDPIAGHEQQEELWKPV